MRPAAVHVIDAVVGHPGIPDQVVAPQDDPPLLNVVDGAAVVAATNDGSVSQRRNITPVGIDYFDGKGRVYCKLTYAASAGAATEGRVVETAGYGPVVRDANADISDYAGSYDQLWYLEQAAAGADADPAYSSSGAAPTAAARSASR